MYYLCQNCNTEQKIKAAVIHGKFFSSICDTCISKEQRLDSPHAAEFNRQSERDKHGKDLIQPFDGTKPNPEFIRAYPEQAKEYFNTKELREHG